MFKYLLLFSIILFYSLFNLTIGKNILSDIVKIVDTDKVVHMYIKNHNIVFVFDNVKVITKSLIFSLIPLHHNEKCVDYYNLLVSEYLHEEPI